MKLTPILSFLLIFSCIYFSFSQNSYATTYYVRPDGGTSTQCTGLADAPYSGAGTGQACAFSHPFWAIAPQGNNPTKMVGGDTLIIDGSNNAQYKMGLGAPNTTDTSKCAAGWPWDCFMSAVPSGPSPTQPTRILGKGWNTGCSNPPQLWANERLSKVINLNGSSNVELQCLEVTDHSACQEFGPNPCNRDTAPYGPWGDTGIEASDSSNVLLNNINVHGMAHTGIHAARLKDWTLQNTQIVANAMAGWDGDMGAGTSSNSGTISFDHVRIEYTGCGETYPGNMPYNCFSQSQGGYGDGIGTQKTGGNWIFTNSNVSHNTQDGIDLLYHDPTGSVTIKRTRAEGNAGNQIKSATNTTIDNSIVIGDCAYFNNNPITWQPSTFDHCRAMGNAIALSFNAGMTATITDSTVLSNGDDLIISMGSTCNGTESIKSLNNVFLGRPNFWKSGENTSLYYASGATGNGDGPCATVKLNDDYSVIYSTQGGTNDCNGKAHSKCMDPKLVEPLVSYYSGNAYNTSLQSNSPAIGSALVIQGASSLDYNNFNRGSTWDIGALQYGSVPGGSTSTPVCGNGVIETGEQCDGSALNGQTCTSQGFSGGGALACTNACTFDTTNCKKTLCGNGTIDSGEQCDSSNLNGQTCTSQGFSGGTLGCTNSCGFDTSGCTSTTSAKPVVNITSPADQSTIAAGGNVPISASATAYGSTINKVYFYDNGTYLGSSASAPYNYTLNNVSSGAHTLSCEVVDMQGRWGSTAAINVTAKSTNTCGNGNIDTGEQCDGSNLNGQSCASQGYTGGSLGCTSTCTFDASGCFKKPVVTITSPTSQSTLTVGANVPITATATAYGTTVNKVYFYDNGTYLGSSASTPYSHTLNNISSGAHTLSCEVVDAKGNWGSTASVAVNVQANTCGNGNIDTGEQCDGANLNGQTCSSQGFTGGALGCTSTCTFDTSSCFKRPVVSITNPTAQTTVSAGSNLPITATATAFGSTVNKVYFYDNGNYLGSSASSPYSYTLNNVSSGAHTISAEVVDTKGNWGATASVAINIQANTCGNGNIDTGEQCDGSNLNGQSCSSQGFTSGTLKCSSTCTLDTSGCQKKPTLTITNPVNQSTISSGSNVAISATATAYGGATIKKVYFYDNGNYLGSSATAPYSFTLNNISSGTHTLTAETVDSSGLWASTATSVVTVGGSSSSSVPVVTILSPVNQSVFSQGSSISIVASALEANGTISRVYFYNGNTLLGSDGSSLYNYVWTNVPSGTYTLTAKAVDANGVSRSSNPITVTVR